jgi:hypothetical protein
LDAGCEENCLREFVWEFRDRVGLGLDEYPAVALDRNVNEVAAVEIERWRSDSGKKQGATVAKDRRADDEDDEDN